MSNPKQSKLGFSVTKRSTSTTGKAGIKAPLKPVDAHKTAPAPKTNVSQSDAKEEDTIHDPILISSDSDVESDEYESSGDTGEEEDAKVSQAPKAAEKKVSAPRAVRTPARKETKTTATVTKVEEDSSADISNPGVSRSSNARTDVAPPAKASAVAEPNVDAKEALPNLKITDARLKKYHAELKAKTGNMPPIHGEAQNKIHEILRIFDTSYEYGPCVGVSRLDRWNRAKALGLNPPKEVQDILSTKQGVTMDEYSQTVFYGEV